MKLSTRLGLATRGTRITGVIALLVAIIVPSAPAAQGTDSCRLVPPTQQLEIRTEGPHRVVYAIAPVVTCAGGARITAEEGTLYESRDEVHLIGNVQFHDPERSLTSDRAIYTGFNGRLYATGNVVFTDHPEGMTIRGPELEYFRATPARQQALAIATQRPHLVLQPKSRAGEAEGEPAEEPILVDADRMTMTGNDQFDAVGRVEIRRSDFRAFSGQAHMDQVQERMELVGEARVHAEQFDLAAERIDMRMPGDQLERIFAYENASLVGDDLRVDSPELQLYFENDELERMIARRSDDDMEGRPVATARGFRLEADSLDALTPDQQLERVIAIGDARGESIDTLSVPPGRIQAPAPRGDLAAGEHDWVVGDTVTGYFVSVEITDEQLALDADDLPDGQATHPGAATANDAEPRRETRLDRILAVGSARSLYRVENNRPESNGRPGINYVIGDAIELTFEEGELQVADVRGLARGLFLDPEAPPAQDAEGEVDELDEDPETDQPTEGAEVARQAHPERP